MVGKFEYFRGTARPVNADVGRDKMIPISTAVKIASGLSLYLYVIFFSILFFGGAALELKEFIEPQILYADQWGNTGTFYELTSKQMESKAKARTLQPIGHIDREWWRLAPICLSLLAWAIVSLPCLTELAKRRWRINAQQVAEPDRKHVAQEGE